MSVPEMGKMLGLGKVESYWLVKKNYFKTIQVDGRMRVMLDSFEDWYAGQFHYKKAVSYTPLDVYKRQTGTGVSTSWIWMSVFLRPRRRTPWTALCWRASWRLNCWQLCGSRTSRNWPLKLPRTGTCPPRRCKADWKRCAPTWSWCRAIQPCCMKCYKMEGYHASRPTTAAEVYHRRPPLF